MSRKREDTVRLIWLEAFVATVDEGSKSAAAPHVGVHKSTVSNYVRDLEGWLGTVLLTSDVPPELTPAGAKFLPKARQVIDLLKSSQANVAQGTPPKLISGKDIKL